MTHSPVPPGWRPRPHITPSRPRKRPAKLHLDKAYDYPRCRRALRRRGITPRIARRGIESSQRLGRHRYLVERSLAWLVGHRRLQVRYERRADVLIGFAYLACALICLKALNASRSFPTPDRMTMPGHHPDQRAPSHKADACLHWLSSAASSACWRSRKTWKRRTLPCRRVKSTPTRVSSPSSPVFRQRRWMLANTSTRSPASNACSRTTWVR